MRHRSHVRLPRRLWRAAGFALCAGIFVLPAPVWAVDNGGLGPLSVRNQFPPSLPFLSFTPEQTSTLPAGGFRFTYQYSVANTFINTQSPDKDPSCSDPCITAAEVEAGLTAGNFPATGYGAYIDAESARHQLAFRYGLADWLELGLDLAWLSYSGGALDSNIESVEKSFSAFNESRAFSERNRFDYYLFRDGEPIFATSDTLQNQAEDPVMHLKWSWGDGGEFLPAVSVKLSYKYPLDFSPGERRRLVSSGRVDSGAYLLLSKEFGRVVGHYQFGSTFIDDPANNFSSQIRHKVFALEVRADSRNSWLFQVVTRSNVLRKSGSGKVDNDFLLSRATDLLAIGHKFKGDTFLFDIGVVEDFNSRLNDTDIVLFLDFGWEFR